MKLMKTMAMLTAAATLLAGTPVMAGEAVDASDFKVGFINSRPISPKARNATIRRQTWQTADARSSLRIHLAMKIT